MSDAAPRRWRRTAAALLLAPCPAIPLVVATLVPIAVAVWWLMSPPVMVLRQGPVDLLFNLAGAWRVYNGQVPHVDFHEPLGQLNFRLTAIGFRLVGFTPRAFLVGELLVLAGIFPTAVFAAWRRLPLAAALSFVLFASLPIIMPINVGSELESFSFAMSYNRYGWCAISVLSLILFIPPRDDSPADLIDVAAGTLLLFAMFYVKITYFFAGVAALTLALVVCPHVRARRYAWSGAAALAAVNAALPHSHPYLVDLWRSATAGLANTSPSLYIGSVLSNAPEYSLCGLGLVAAVWSWRRGQTPSRLPAAAAFLIAASMLLITQNTQIRGVPLATVIAYMLYAAVAQRGAGRLTDTMMLLVALLVYPVLSVASYAGTIAAYYRTATNRDALHVLERSNLRGLAIPLADFGPRQPAQIEYFDTIVDAIGLLQTRSVQGSVVNLDRVNPFPFALGLAPARGGDLFGETFAPLRPADEVFGDAAHVLVPKQPTSFRVTESARAGYGSYLAERFPVREEDAHWTLLSRR